MNGVLPIVLFLALGLLCFGGLVAGVVLLVLWGRRQQSRSGEALTAAGFERVGQLGPDLA